MPKKFESGEHGFTPEGSFEYRIQEIEPEDWPRRSATATEKLKPPRPEQVERMDKELVALGNLLKDFPGWWQLDGGLNVALAAGEYFRAHADVDVSFLRDDIPQLEAYLHERGYGFFLHKREERGEEGVLRTFRRMGAENLQRSAFWQYRIGALGEHGEINKKTDLVTVEMAIIERDKTGKLTTWDEIPMPENWLHSRVDTSKGVSIHLSNPGRFIYHKIFFDRPVSGQSFDFDDLKRYVEAGAVSSKDLDELAPILQESFRKFEQGVEAGKKALQGVFPKIRLGMGAGEVSQILNSEPNVQRFFDLLSPHVRADTEFKEKIIQAYSKRIASKLPNLALALTVKMPSFISDFVYKSLSELFLVRREKELMVTKEKLKAIREMVIERERGK